MIKADSKREQAVTVPLCSFSECVRQCFDLDSGGRHCRHARWPVRLSKHGLEPWVFPARRVVQGLTTFAGAGRSKFNPMLRD